MKLGLLALMTFCTTTLLAQSGWLPDSAKNVPTNYVRATNNKGEIGWMPAPIPICAGIRDTTKPQLQWINNQTGKEMKNSIHWQAGTPVRKIAEFTADKRLIGYDSTGRIIYYKDYGRPFVVVDSTLALDNLFKVMELTIYQKLIER